MRRTLQWSLALTLLAVLSPAAAQSLRDPTLPPVEAGVAGAPSAENPSRVEAEHTSVIVRDGRSYLVVGTRLYAQGEKLGQTRIERISETEIWLREAGKLRKVQRFNGIERHAAVTLVQSTGCASSVPKKRTMTKASKPSKASGVKKTSRVSKKPSSSKTSPVVTPCVDIRP